MCLRAGFGIQEYLQLKVSVKVKGTFIYCAAQCKTYLPSMFPQIHIQQRPKIYLESQLIHHLPNKLRVLYPSPHPQSPVSTKLDPWTINEMSSPKVGPAAHNTCHSRNTFCGPQSLHLLSENGGQYSRLCCCLHKYSIIDSVDVWCSLLHCTTFKTAHTALFPCCVLAWLVTDANWTKLSLVQFIFSSTVHNLIVSFLLSQMMPSLTLSWPKSLNVFVKVQTSCLPTRCWYSALVVAN